MVWGSRIWAHRTYAYCSNSSISFITPNFLHGHNGSRDGPQLQRSVAIFMVTTGRCFDKFYLCIKLSQRLPSEMETTAPFGLMFGLEMRPLLTPTRHSSVIVRSRRLRYPRCCTPACSGLWCCACLKGHAWNCITYYRSSGQPHFRKHRTNGHLYSAREIQGWTVVLFTNY